MTCLHHIVDAVQVVKAVQQPSGTSWYTHEDIWLFRPVFDDKVCDVCAGYEAEAQWHGDEIVLEFPDHMIVDADRIKVNIHPNCRCYLERVII
jgi:hypothetical protein